MAKRHLFSINAPKNWPINRKENKWTIRPNPGRHPLERCLPLGLVLKNLLNYASKTREVRYLLNNGEIKIDGNVVKNYKFPVGLMDIIEIKKTNEFFRLMITKEDKYKLYKISKDESSLKPCKIINKTILKKGISQLNLYDGRNINVDKDGYNVGDTIILDLSKNKINSHLKFETGSLVYITGGKYIGYIGKLDKIINYQGLQKDKIIFIMDDKKYETLKNYCFVIDKNLVKEK